jgi:cytochrome c-type biogenesis protein CcmH/NrfG
MSSNAPNSDVLLKMAADAAQKGQKEPARMMLQQVLQMDPRNVRAMMWMAKVAANNQERREWLERILKVDPKNKIARQALHKTDSADQSQRNRLLLRAGAVAYVLLVMIISIIYTLVSIS